jgi:hypothetical protein
MDHLRSREKASQIDDIAIQAAGLLGAQLPSALTIAINGWHQAQYRPGKDERQHILNAGLR